METVVKDPVMVEAAFHLESNLHKDSVVGEGQLALYESLHEEEEDDEAFAVVVVEVVVAVVVVEEEADRQNCLAEIYVFSNCAELD
jgi:hypothetical protein